MRFKSLTSELPRHPFSSPPPFRSSQKHSDCHSAVPTLGKGTVLSPQNLKQGSALFRNAQVTIQVFLGGGWGGGFHLQKKKIRPKCSSERRSCPHALQLSHSPSLILVDSRLCQVSSASFLRCLSSLFTFLSQKLLHSLCRRLNFLLPISLSLPPFENGSLSHANHLLSFTVSASPSPRQSPSSW